jgi:hypothetical protein
VTGRAAALTLAAMMLVGGVGVASAATGGSFLLGKSNQESSPASLSSSHGAALALSAPKNTAPFSVNRQKMVSNLNAQLVGGLNAASLKLSGGEGFVPPNADIQLNGDEVLPVTGTGRLPAGTYYVTATALIDLTTGDTGATCFIEKDNDINAQYSLGGASGSNFVQVAGTVAVLLKKGDTMHETCIVDGSNSGSEAIDAGITAIRVLSSSGKKGASGDTGLMVTTQPGVNGTRHSG